MYIYNTLHIQCMCSIYILHVDYIYHTHQVYVVVMKDVACLQTSWPKLGYQAALRAPPALLAARGKTWQNQRLHIDTAYLLLS